MPRTGGVFTSLWQWVSDAITYPNMQPTRFDAYLNDMASAINTSLATDGTNSPTANLPMAGFVHTSVGNATLRTNYPSTAQVQDNKFNFATDTGTANTYAIAPVPSIAGYAIGQTFWFVPVNSNTSVSTLNVNGLGDKTIKNGAVDMAAGDISSGKAYSVYYDGTNFQLITPVAVSTSLYVPTGSLMSFAGSTAPSGWLLSYGQAVSRNTYAALFVAIGTVYGAGNGTTTFNLPDLRGRGASGVDNMGGTTASRITSGVSGIAGTTLGAAGGDQNMFQHTHTATVTDPGHTHTPEGFGVSTGTASTSISIFSNGARNDNSKVISTSTTGVTVANSNTGTGTSQNVQPTIMLNYIIKT